MSQGTKVFLGVWLALYVAVTMGLRSMRATSAEWASWGTDALNTTTLFAMLAAFVWPILRGLIDQAIVDQTRAAAQAEERLEKAEEERAAARIRLAGIDAEIEAVKKREREATAEDVRHLADLAESEARQIREHGARDRAREVAAIEREVVARIAAAAAGRARTALASRLDPAAHERLVRALLEEVPPA